MQEVVKKEATNGFEELVDAALKEDLMTMINLLVKGASLFRPWNENKKRAINIVHILVSYPAKKIGEQECLLEILLWQAEFNSPGLFSFIRTLVGDNGLEKTIKMCLQTLESMRYKRKTVTERSRPKMLEQLKHCVDINTSQTYYLWYRYVQELTLPFRDNLLLFLFWSQEVNKATEGSTSERKITEGFPPLPIECTRMILSHVLPHLKKGTLFRQGHIENRWEACLPSYPATSRVLFHESFARGFSTDKLNTALRAEGGPWETEAPKEPIWTCSHVCG